MKNLIVFSVFISVFASESFASDKKYTQAEYVSLWKDVAVSQMHSHKIPASITLAQGILESGNGNSVLAQKANNHFGIKCHDWKGETIYIDDDKKNECFRSYPDASDSYKDHSLFLTGRSRYAGLFSYQITDYKNWAQGLKDAGYATNPKYPQLLIDLIERLKLHEFDQAALPPKPTDVLIDNKEDKKSPQVKEQKQEREPLFKRKQKVKKETTVAAPVLKGQHQVLVHKNEIKYIVAKKGDTYYRISKELDIALWQLYKYNEFGATKDVLNEGDIVYLQPKRNKSRTDEKFTVSKSVSLRTIAHQEGVKLEKLMERNQITAPDELLKKGTVIQLK